VGTCPTKGKEAGLEKKDVETLPISLYIYGATDTEVPHNNAPSLACLPPFIHQIQFAGSLVVLSTCYVLGSMQNLL